jgi:WD40 repeat protein
LWDVETGKQRAVLPKQPDIVGCVAFSPGGENLVTAGGTEESGEVHCWDATNWKQRWSLKTPRGLVRCIAFSPDGKTLATGEGMGRPGQVVLRDAATGNEQAVWDAHEQDVFALAFSPDGKTLASCGKERVVKLRDLADGTHRVIIKQKSGWIRSLAFSPDGHLLALACGDYDPASRRASGDVRLWDMGADKERQPLRGHRGFLTSVAFSPNGKTLAAGAEGREIVLWRRLSE